MEYSPSFIVDSHATLLEFQVLEDHVEKDVEINPKYIARTMSEKLFYLYKKGD